MSHTFFAAKPLLIGLSAMVLCCFAGGAGANTTTGPAYFVNDAHPKGTYFKVGADGKDGGMTGWDKNDNCVSPAPNPKEGPAGAGAAAEDRAGPRLRALVATPRWLPVWRWAVPVVAAVGRWRSRPPAVSSRPASAVRWADPAVAVAPVVW